MSVENLEMSATVKSIMVDLTRPIQPVLNAVLTRPRLEITGAILSCQAADACHLDNSAVPVWRAQTREELAKRVVRNLSAEYIEDPIARENHQNETRSVLEDLDIIVILQENVQDKREQEQLHEAA